MYKPDKWAIFKMTIDETISYKIFSGWYGSYLDGESWRASSEIGSVELIETTGERDVPAFRVTTISGSAYELYDSLYGYTGYSGMMWQSIKDSLAKNHPNAMMESMEESEAKEYLNSLIKVKV
jgi:hypothetical protein